MSRRNQNSSPMSLFSFQDIITATTGILILLALVLALSVIVQNNKTDDQPKIADKESISLRDDLINEVQQLRVQSETIANDAATWTSLTPAELRKKIKINLDRQNYLLANIASGENSLRTLKTKFDKLDPIQKLQALTEKLNITNESSTKILNQIAKLKTSNRVIYSFRDSNRSAWLVEVEKNQILSAKIGSKSQPRKFESALHFNRFAASLPESQQYFILVVKPTGIANYEAIKPYLVQLNADIGTELIGENQTVIDPIKGVGF